jgi:1-acyl-sn-glycerol-3-phosphate acyltransferase
MKYANPEFNPLLYSIGKNLPSIAFDLVWRREIRGRDNIPPKGTGVIFAANHRSMADPHLVGTSIPYPIHFFAKAELFNIPLLGWCLPRVNAFPVRRAIHDVGALKTAQKLVEKGEGLLMFPEGGRRLKKERQWVARPGVAMLACQTGIPVVPVGVRNSENFVKFGKVRVSFGPPIMPPKEYDRDTYQTFSELIMKRIRELAEAS